MIIYNEIYKGYNIDIIKEGRYYRAIIDGEQYYRKHQSIKLSLYAIHRIIDGTNW